MSPTPVVITRRMEIDYGHRLIGHESKCCNVHGHRGVVEVMATAAKLDRVGRVIDFSVLKTEIGGWLDEHWDHAFIHQKGDPIADFLIVHEQRRFELDKAPTAENLALFLLDKARGLMRAHSVEIVGIRFYETTNCYAEVHA